MRFKGTKDEVLNKVMNSIQNNSFINIDTYAITNQHNHFKQQIEWTIQNSVSAAFQELINNIYTEEEFEQDMGLNKP